MGFWDAFFNFADNHPVAVFFLAFVVLGSIAEIVRAFRGRK